MANTVTSLSNANTFGHWLTATSALISENNDLAANNYVKDSGTIYLSEGTLTALQSNGNVIVQKAFSVTGAGSSATIEKDLTVQRQGLFTNTGLSLTTSGSANIANVLHVLGSGSALVVANNARVVGDLYVGGDLDLNVLEARQYVNTSTVSVTGTTYTSKLQSNNQIVTDVLTANSAVYTSRLQSNTSITTTSLQANTVINAAAISATTGIYTNTLQANSTVNTANASIVYTLYANVVQANVSTNTENASVTGTVYTKNLLANSFISSSNIIASNIITTNTLFANIAAYAYDQYTTNTSYTDIFYANTVYIQNNVVTVGNTNSASFFASSNVTTPTLHSVNSYGDYLTANLHIYTPAIDVEGTTLTRFVQANSSINTSHSSVVNTSYTKYLVANTLVTTAGLNSTGKTHTNTLQANTSANTETISVTQRALIDQVQANTSVNTQILSVSTTALVDKLQANSSVNTAVISVTGNTITNRVQANTSVNTATMFVADKIDANNAAAFVGSLQVLNQFSVDGNFVINGATVYNSNVFTINAGSNEGLISSFTVNRGVTGANAAIRWNEASGIWDILKTTNGTYYRILTNEHLSDSVESTSSLVVATSVAANTVNNNIATANTYLKARVTSAESFANGAFLRANSSYTSQNITALFANTAFRHANAAYDSANNVAPQVAPAYAHANASFDKANNVISSIKGTTGAVAASLAGVTLKSNNGIVIFATNDNNTGNTLTISTPQDLRTTASPTFAGLSLTTPLPVGQGGTSTSSHASLFDLAIFAAAGVGGVGKVLSTDGNRTYSWVTAGTGGDGGGTQPGSRISSVRLTYSGDNTTAKFTTPTFSAGTQLRAYINGVRQLESEYYSFTANSIIWFTNPPATGDKILVEVDGYMIYEYFANNIVYGPAEGAMEGATIQAAIDNLESRKMPKIGGTFTGRVEGLTMPLAQASNTVFATGLYVTNHANSGYTLSHSITGNAGTVTNGLYSSESYTNPNFITSLANTKITGTIADGQLNNSGVAAATYGNANTIPKFVVDAKGRVTGVTNTAISILKTQISDFPTFTDATNADNITTGILPEDRLASKTGLTAGTYGGADKVGRFTVNAKGLITAVSDSQISIGKSAISDFPTLAASATTDTTNATNITIGTLPDARMPTGYAKLAGAAFTGETTLTGTNSAKIKLAMSGDITAYRTVTTTGAIWLNNAETRGLINDGTKYSLPGQSLEVNGATVLNTSDEFTITGNRYYRSDASVGTAGQAGRLVVHGTPTSAGVNHANMSFYRPIVGLSSAYGINLGMDNDNIFRIGGWSDGSVTYRMTLDTVGNAVFRNNVTAYSDERLKTNIQTITNALDTVLKMRGVTYERIDSGTKGVGVIAQEMKEVLPEVVMEAASDDEFMSVAYGNIVGVLIEAIKELKSEIEELKGQIK